ncbi:MAG TPA: PTS transporter subunit IIC [Bacillota bacterium]|jgi:PTS system galactitol-specific IIC component|uniref:PTS system, galactitol-specific IIC component n=1 Tax=anaerobic digester metagenome TaxID=1263854 RepID=A0A485LVU2_9ZZZZ|nr:PTS transporter subunit IIC [Bacillota bacterium]HPZ11430.1 PTS transporter subunit IIC [Bacillota bacterium]HQE09604.1 PTS transporter subunit IIC [Bacillota bacterium]
MDWLMKVINFIMDAGPAVFMPLIILLLGVAFGQRFGKALRGGITVGVAFIGIGLVIDLLAESIMVIVNQMVEVYGFSLTAIDVGWPIASSIAWGSGVVVPFIIVAIFLLNILLLAVRWTKTLMVDIWNYWQPLFLGGVVYMMTGSIWYAVLGACVAMAIMWKIADFSQPYIRDFYGMEGISIPHIETGAWALIGIPLNKLIDRIPVINKINWSPEVIQKRLGVFGEPTVLGLIIGSLLAIIARADALTVLNTGISTAAAMFLLPRIIGILMEGLLPLSEAAGEFMKRRFKDREVYIGLDSAVILGHPSIIATALLLVPTILILAIILPGNKTLPLAELGGLVFFIVWAVIPANGNIFRGWLIGTLFMIPILYIASDYAPAMTALGQQVGFEFPEGASVITCLSIGSQWLTWIIYKIQMFFFGLF